MNMNSQGVDFGSCAIAYEERCQTWKCISDITCVHSYMWCVAVRILFLDCDYCCHQPCWCAMTVSPLKCAHLSHLARFIAHVQLCGHQMRSHFYSCHLHSTIQFWLPHNISQEKVVYVVYLAEVATQQFSDRVPRKSHNKFFFAIISSLLVTFKWP